MSTTVCGVPPRLLVIVPAFRSNFLTSQKRPGTGVGLTWGNKEVIMVLDFLFQGCRHCGTNILVLENDKNIVIKVEDEEFFSMFRSETIFGYSRVH